MEEAIQKRLEETLKRIDENCSDDPPWENIHAK